MSDMELNKGKLIPVENPEEVCKMLFNDSGEELGYGNKTCVDWANNEVSDIQVINGICYRVEEEVFNGDEFGFAIVDKNEDGSISFFTYHYNGGGHWTEVVADELKDIEK